MNKNGTIIETARGKIRSRGKEQRNGARKVNIEYRRLNQWDGEAIGTRRRLVFGGQEEVEGVHSSWTLRRLLEKEIRRMHDVPG